jgi:hypothetical protein
VSPRFLFPPFLLVAVVLVGCGGDDDRPAAWGYISPAIIQPNCATSSCHSRAVAVAGLDLSTAESGHHDLLAQKLPVLKDDEGRDIETRKDAKRAMVVPFNPDQSRLLNMLRAIGASRMPPDRPLAEADIALVERWILAGAKP